jgi:hypothetical protein
MLNSSPILSGLALGAFFVYIFYSLPVTTSKRIIEIKCVNDDLFDSAKRCNEVAKNQPGTTMDLTVNMSTQHVLFEVVGDNPEGWDKAFILDHCAIVNNNSWKCVSESKLGFTAEAAALIRSEFGMLQGRFYRSYTSKDPPNFYSSSISRWQYWGYRIGLFPLSEAIKLSR